MIVTFCGHSNFRGNEEQKLKVLEILEREVGMHNADLYLGGYGGFDEFAYECCKAYKESYPNVSLIFITPYITDSYQRNRLTALKAKYDRIFYPDIENRPLKFAISYRNQWMVEESDLVICAINHDWGGAFQTYQYAKRKKKTIFNIEKFEA